MTIWLRERKINIFFFFCLVFNKKLQWKKKVGIGQNNRWRLVGVSMGQVCAQPRLDLTTSSSIEAGRR